MDLVKQTISQLEALMQVDPGDRGVANVPEQNLCSATQGHLLHAAQSLLATPPGSVAITSGFLIPDADPVAPETDGPMGACALARVLAALNYQVVMIAESECLSLLEATSRFFKGDNDKTAFVEFPHFGKSDKTAFNDWQLSFLQNYPGLRTLISIERAGPCYTIESLQNQYEDVPSHVIEFFKETGPGDLAGRMLNMAGRDITEYTAPVYMLFENLPESVFTIGIGDGGNEIGMGSIPWHIINQNIYDGGKIACRVKTDATLVAGVSNWGGYALAAAVTVLANQPNLFLTLVTEAGETELLTMYENTGIAVDGVLHRPSGTVDGIDWDVHLNIIGRMRQIVHNFIDRNPKSDGDI